jgi:Ca2+-transporting ATPase
LRPITGESLPVKKSIEQLLADAALADRKNMVFMGTIVSYGNCRVAVTATGLSTELGRISGMIKQRQADPPLKIKLEHLAKRQALLVFAIAAIVFVLDSSRGTPIMDSLIAAIALAVAGVPEALPFIVTLALAFGTQAMARKNAIIRRLPAVETLGSTTVICTDKTGTLTTGEMMLREIQTYRTIYGGTGTLRWVPSPSKAGSSTPGRGFWPGFLKIGRLQQRGYREGQRQLAHCGRSNRGGYNCRRKKGRHS